MTALQSTGYTTTQSPVVQAASGRTSHPTVATTLAYPPTNISPTVHSTSTSQPTITQTPYYTGGHNQSIASGRIYVPPNTEYVAPGMPLKGGMYTVYDSSLVPTFEAPIAFSANGLISRSLIDHTDMEFVGQGQSDEIPNNVCVTRRSKRKGCCPC